MDDSRHRDLVPAVVLDDVRRMFRHGTSAVTALAGVSQTFERGSFTAVMGRSGSGKSTLLQCAAGLDRPTSGAIHVGGVDLGSLDDAALTELRRTQIGFVFQAFNLLPALTAAKNVALPLRLAGRRPLRSDIEAALASVGMAHRADHRPSELSGGEQQRVAIARALAVEPAVVFADEPTGALDTATSHDVLALLRGLVDDHGQTVVTVTHEPTAATWADRVVFLADGRLSGVLEAPTVEAITSSMAGHGA